MSHASVDPLDGQVAITTGASSGLGRATALALARAGADVALLARTATDLEQAAQDVRSVGRRALPIAVDLAREAEVFAAAEREARATNPSPSEALPPEDVAAFVAWLASAPPEVVVNEAVVTPLHERGWP